MLKNIKAWKSSVVGIVAIIAICFLVYTGKISDSLLSLVIPALIPIFTDWFKEHKVKKNAEELIK